MALTITNGGTAFSTSASTSVQETGVTVSVGSMIILIVGASNDGTSGANSFNGTVETDIAGDTNVFVERLRSNYTPGSTAGDGASVIVFTCNVTTAFSNNYMLCRFASTTNQKSLHYYVVSGSSGTPTFGTAGPTNGSGANTSTPSITTDSIPNGYTVFGVISAETNQAITGDTDTTNGSWSTYYGVIANGGTDDTAINCRSQWKTVNASGTQTFNPTIAAARDNVVNWFTIYESSPAGASSGAGAAAAVSARLISLSPDGDVSDGGWTTELGGTVLYASIDEGDVDDADFIRSVLSPSADVCEVSLSDPAGAVGEDVVVEYRYAKVGGEQINLVVYLKEGTTTIASWTHTNISTTLVTASQTLTAPQVASITNYSSLSLRFEATAV